MNKAISEKVLFFDMEMIPAEEEKRPMLEEWFREKGKEESEIGSAFEYTSVDGAWGRVLCIAYAFGEGEIEALYDESLDEKKIIEEFWKKVDACDVIVGHKILDADLLFLHQRSIVLGITPSRYYNLEGGYDERVFDSAWEWGRGKKYASLEKLTMALGLPNPKKEMHGSQVPKYHREGRDGEIIEYCKQDTEAVRGIYKKIVATRL